MKDFPVPYNADPTDDSPANVAADKAWVVDAQQSIDAELSKGQYDPSVAISSDAK